MRRPAVIPVCEPCDEPMLEHVLPSNQDRGALAFWRCPGCGAQTGHRLVVDREPEEADAA